MVLFTLHPSLKKNEIQESIKEEDALIFFVNENNSINSIDINTIQNIYNGKINNWKQVNGVDYKIIPFRNSSKHLNEYIRLSLIGELELNYNYQYFSAPNIPNNYETPIPVQSGGFMYYKYDDSNIYYTSVIDYMNFQNAIGYSLKSILDERIIEENQSDIKYLGIDGVFPSEENIANETYPFIY